jgi:hypothetical protein
MDRLREALDEEQIALDIYRVHSSFDNLEKWFRAINKLDDLVKEIGIVLEKPQPTDDDEDTR